MPTCDPCAGGAPACSLDADESSAAAGSGPEEQRPALRRSATMSPEPTAEIDARFSDPAAGPTPWSDAARALERAELYWLTTVRADGRPHVTPLIGVADNAAVHFCTGLGEQKARNLEHSGRVALTTGNNTWARGLD